ncbi:hypothetical protein ACWGQ4_27755 [Streptomyces sp. NPDC055721]|uniref:hypothetical protein n=1 Tax=Streptomyces sp. NPDC127132 TaxID=3345374 RepID=UPI003633BEA5
MRTSFKVHAALAGGPSALMLLVATLTFLPGRLPLPSPAALMAVCFVVLFPVFGATVIRGMAFGADRGRQWPAFRCLPGRVQLAAGMLLGAGILVTVVASTMGESTLQDPEIRDGRYYAFSTAVGHRGTVEVGAEEYAEIREHSQGLALAIPGTMLAGAAVIVLICGELRRADDAVADNNKG